MAQPIPAPTPIINTQTPTMYAPQMLSPAYGYVRDNSEMMTIVILLLVIVIVYLWYQNKSLKSGTSTMQTYNPNMANWKGMLDTPGAINTLNGFEPYPGYDADRKVLNNLAYIKKHGGALTADQQNQFNALWAKVSAAATSSGTSINFDDYDPSAAGGPVSSSACTLFNAQDAVTSAVDAATLKYDLSGAAALASSEVAPAQGQVGGVSTLTDARLASVMSGRAN